MRTLRVSLLVFSCAIAACGGSDKRGATSQNGAPEAAGSRGPDPVLIRIPRAGGTARGYLYPKLDSVVWSGRGTSIGRVLGFDPEGGTLAIVDAKGNPGRVDLRMGDAGIASRVVLTSLSSANGADIYGIDPKGTVLRLTRSGNWTLTPPAPARAVFPQSDGTLIVIGQRGEEALVWRVRPPETKVADTTILVVGAKGARVQVGDRIYFGTDTGLVGVKTRDLSVVPSIRFTDRIVAIAPTPSGDRMYAATTSQHGISVIDRYTDKVVTEIELPGVVAELRMDPLGRYVIARPVKGDSAWVIAVATDHLVGTIHTNWTADLPASAPDGAIVVNTGRDVVFLDGETLQPVRTVPGGASDYWYFMFWNGFRPRAAGLDQPVSFGSGKADSLETAAADSAAGIPLDSLGMAPGPQPQGGHPGQPSTPPAPPAAPVPVATAPAAGTPPGTPPAKPAAPRTFSVSFAALLNEEKAKTLAASIAAGGKKAHVVSAQRAGTMIYRVVLGPFPTHEAAQQAGDAVVKSGSISQKTYWVYADEQ